MEPSVSHHDAFLLCAMTVLFTAAALPDGLVRIDMRAAAPAFARLESRGTGWFLVANGVSFAALWLADIVPAICSGRPPSGAGAERSPNTIYILDLTVALPLVIFGGRAFDPTPCGGARVRCDRAGQDHHVGS